MTFLVEPETITQQVAHSVTNATYYIATIWILSPARNKVLYSVLFYSIEDNAHQHINIVSARLLTLLVDFRLLRILDHFNYGIQLDKLSLQNLQGIKLTA